MLTTLLRHGLVASIGAAVTTAAILLASSIRADAAPHWMTFPEIAGLTIVTFNRSHGTQVEYFTRNRCYLWYPGNTKTVNCSWKIGPPQTFENGIRDRAMCFKYDGTTVNPVSKKVSRNEWQCRPLMMFWRKIVTACRGDKYGLQSGAIPYVSKKSVWQVQRIERECDG